MASETQATITIPVPAVTREGPLQRPSLVPPVPAPGPVSHTPTLGLGHVYQDVTNDGEIGLCGWLRQISPQVAVIVLITAHLHFISNLASPVLAPLTHWYKEEATVGAWGMRRPQATKY